MATANSDFTKQKLWGGRFTGETDPLMNIYNESLSYDKRMYQADIRGSQAYAVALQSVGILTASETEAIHSGLEKVLLEWSGNTFAVRPSDEDIHTANERRLSEIIGSDIGGKLHTGRSRNDQVATDMRIWLREQTLEVQQFLVQLIEVMANRAEAEVDILMPGYTHLQRAQPIRWSHFLLSHAFSLSADLDRLRNMKPRINQCPLGSGAMGGHSFNIDRVALAKSLGFEGVCENSMNAVADRDFIVEWLQWASLTMIHIGKFAEDMIIYSTAEFGFIQLSDAYSTGSSIMPQKKNPDSLELLRGKGGRVFGHMSGFMVSLKGTPSTYNKDLQEDKEPLFDCVDTVRNSIQIASGVIGTLNVNKEKMLAALTMDMLATDLADYLVRKGVPFRESHHISGRCVALAEKTNSSLHLLSIEQLQGVDARFSADIKDIWSFEVSVERKNARGGPARSAVQKQVEVLKSQIA